MDNQALWKLMDDVWGHIKAEYRAALESFVNGYQVPDFRDWGLLLAVKNFEPEQTTPAHLLIRNPYAAVEMYLERLENLQVKGLLVQPSEGRFSLTDYGQEAVRRYINQARAAMQPPGELNVDALQGSVSLLDRLVVGCLEAPSPPNKWSILFAYKLMPAKSEVFPFIEQALTCLAAYQEDAHLAAWRKSKLNATALKVLTIFWNGESHSFDDLCRRLAPLGHACEVYEGVVKELRQREFLAVSNDEIFLTALGRLRRTEIEAAATQYFFEAWNVLTDEEKTQLGELFTQLHTSYSHVRV